MLSATRMLKDFARTSLVIKRKDPKCQFLSKSNQLTDSDPRHVLVASCQKVRHTFNFLWTNRFLSNFWQCRRIGDCRWCNLISGTGNLSLPSLFHWLSNRWRRKCIRPYMYRGCWPIISKDFLSSWVNDNSLKVSVAHAFSPVSYQCFSASFRLRWDASIWRRQRRRLLLLLLPPRLLSGPPVAMCLWVFALWSFSHWPDGAVVCATRTHSAESCAILSFDIIHCGASCLCRTLSSRLPWLFLFCLCHILLTHIFLNYSASASTNNNSRRDKTKLFFMFRSAGGCDFNLFRFCCFSPTTVLIPSSPPFSLAFLFSFLA